MRILGPAVAAALLLTGCDGGAPVDDAGSTGNAAALARPPLPPAAKSAEGKWDLQSSGEGVALAYPASGRTEVRLFCPAGGSELLVNLPGFRPVGSEERLSFGSRGEVVALVADTRGDRLRGGVSGTGPVPANLARLIAGPLAANYGSQDSGPHPAPPPALARAFVAACREGAASPPPPPPPPLEPAAPQAGACRMQDGVRLDNKALRAIGTEPFWGARIEGRCVTYSHPDDQGGTRVWTRFTPAAQGGGRWSGSLGGRPFVLVVAPEQDCSDGMSDRLYPFGATLAVNGEQRRGCATPG